MVVVVLREVPMNDVRVMIVVVVVVMARQVCVLHRQEPVQQDGAGSQHQSS